MGDIVAGLGVEVGVGDCDETVLVNGGSKVGFGCCLVAVVLTDDGKRIGLGGTSTGGNISSTRGTSNLTACDGSIEDPHKIIFHPRKVPLLLGFCWSFTLIVQSPTGFSPLQRRNIR